MVSWGRLWKRARVGVICRAHAILANYAVGRDSVKERTDRMFFGDRMKTLAPPWPGLDVIKRKVPAQAGVSFCHVSRPGCGLRSSALLGAMLHR